MYVIFPPLEVDRQYCGGAESSHFVQVFGRRPRCVSHCRDRPSFENLHKSRPSRAYPTAPQSARIQTKPETWLSLRIIEQREERSVYTTFYRWRKAIAPNGSG
jgi:hypothetical protein